MDEERVRIDVPKLKDKENNKVENAEILWQDTESKETKREAVKEINIRLKPK